MSEKMIEESEAISSHSSKNLTTSNKNNGVTITSYFVILVSRSPAHVLPTW